MGETRDQRKTLGVSRWSMGMGIRGSFVFLNGNLTNMNNHQMILH